MELNTKDIIKGLESCTRGRKSKEDMPCLDCVYNECNLVGGTSERQIKGTCQGWLMKDALALIKQLTQAHEMLSESYDALEKTKDELLAERSKLILENERYRAEQHEHFEKWLKLEKATREHHAELFKDAKIAVKEETVREMQERLHGRFGDDANRVFSNYNIHRYIDQIAKETLEGAGD